MAGYLPLFAKALLAAYRAHGDGAPGMMVQPIHEYQWTTIRPDDTSILVHQNLWSYLNNDPAVWKRMDREFAYAMRDTGLDALYVGGGSGRFGLYLESLGRSCHHIDTADDAITLMNLRGASGETMDGTAMTFGANAYPLVALATDVFDCVPDPEAMIVDAARVAANRLLVMGGTEGDEVVALHGVLAWDRETEEADFWARPAGDVVAWIEATGMSIVRQVAFLVDVILDDGTEVTEEYWLIEAQWA